MERIKKNLPHHYEWKNIDRRSSLAPKHGVMTQPTEGYPLRHDSTAFFSAAQFDSHCLGGLTDVKLDLDTVSLTAHHRSSVKWSSTSLFILCNYEERLLEHVIYVNTVPNVYIFNSTSGPEQSITIVPHLADSYTIVLSVFRSTIVLLISILREK